MNKWKKRDKKEDMRGIRNIEETAIARMPSLDFREEGFDEEESSNPRPNGFVFSIVRETHVKSFHSVL